MTRENNPYRRWRKAHPHEDADYETNLLLTQWITISSAFSKTEDYLRDSVIPWHAGEINQTPNLLWVIANYGWMGLTISSWKKFPIDIPPEEMEDWEKHTGFTLPLSRVHRRRAGIAGCIPNALHDNTELVVSTLKSQVADLISRLDMLVNKPLSEFTPTQWTEDDLGEEWTYEEDKALEEIFHLFEDLWCFEHGIEELRMLMITESNPKFHLPNPAFYEALCSIDSHQIMLALERAEPKLKEILKLWAQTIITVTGKPYHRPRVHTAPKEFWWRHWKTQAPNRSGRSRSSRRPNRK